MHPRVWVNPRQPQTLYIAQILMYFQGGFDLLFWVMGMVPVRTLFGSAVLGAAYLLLVVVGKLAAAFGIANEMRWGYRLGVAAAAAPLALRVLAAAGGGLRVLFGNPISLMFDIALFALLLHPNSVNYQRYWRARR